MGKILKLWILILTSIVLGFPIWIMVSNGFSPNKGMLDLPPRLLPYRFTLENYIRIGRLPLLSRVTANSLLVMLVLIVGAILIAASAAYVFRVGRSKKLKYIFWALMAPIFVTRITVFISQFVIVNKLGLHGMPAVIIIPMFWPVGIFLFRNYYATIPDSFLESAWMDGASELRSFAAIMLPLSRPMVGLGVVMLGLSAWGDYIWQNVNLQIPKTQTLLVALVNSTLDIIELEYIGYDLAVGTVLFLPYIILFAASGRYFVKGLTAGGLR
jgi:multiple sugar transport system permease protein